MSKFSQNWSWQTLVFEVSREGLSIIATIVVKLGYTWWISSDCLWCLQGWTLGHNQWFSFSASWIYTRQQHQQGPPHGAGESSIQQLNPRLWILQQQWLGVFQLHRPLLPTFLAFPRVRGKQKLQLWPDTTLLWLGSGWWVIKFWIFWASWIFFFHPPISLK
jgi:hypothetical protein